MQLTLPLFGTPFWALRTKALSNIMQWLTDLGQKPAAEQAAFIAKLPSGMLSCRKRVSDLMDICEKAFGTSGRSVLQQGKRCIERLAATIEKNGECAPLNEAKEALEAEITSHVVLIGSLKDVKNDANSWTVFNITTNLDNVASKFSDLEESGKRIVADISRAGKLMSNLAKDSRKKDSQDNVNAISITKHFLYTHRIGRLTISWLKDSQGLPSDDKIAQMPLPGYKPSSPAIDTSDEGLDYLDFLSGHGQVSFEFDSQGYPLEFVQSWNLFWTMHHKNA